ncbi:transmembrane protein 94 isoform X2 [Lepeophtheirus salmonis]|uniref:transmembrane protein 94 isoform X2 n=1 Tax=Lepeophtheirus salmonis TaxID=72036 RepID=UPI001AE62BF4|nr:transmembrane protein 94-like isoform X2 [Lepeophtheirus salmonis]
MHKGLSTHEALDQLLKESASLLSTYGKFELQELVWSCLCPTTSLFPITNIFWAILCIAILAVSRCTYHLVLFGFLILNLILIVSESLLTRKEIFRRTDFILNKVQDHSKEISEWSKDNYPDLNTPYSSSIKLQWTQRDGYKVNLPWSLLVKGDLIYLRPGQEAPGLCKSLHHSTLTLKSEEIFRIKSESSSKTTNQPEFKTPLPPEPFLLVETPYVEQLKLIFKADKSDKYPTSLLYKYAFFLFIHIPCHRILPLSSILFIIVALIHWNLGFVDLNIILCSFAGIIIPLVPFVFPTVWILSNAWAYARLHKIFHSLRHLKINDPFEGLHELRHQNKIAPGILETLGPFISIIFGSGEYLFRKKNLVRSFGSISALGCTDKKGILSWPNKSAEKIFMLVRDRDKSSGVSSEILNITPNHSDPFHVEFDDPSWINFSESLKPIGLNILLNTCHLSTQEKYNNFFYHLKYDAQVEAPIASRGCLCQLSKKIGFKIEDIISNKFNITSHIQTFHSVSNKLSEKIKFPIPHLLSVITQDKVFKSNQLFSQGSADLLLNSCRDFWCGDDLEPLKEDIRKKILDFYKRASLTSYCTAFSYKPIIIPLKEWKEEKYLRISDKCCKHQWEYSVYTEEPPQIQEDMIIRENDDDFLSPADCLEIQCNQTFLGMVQLEYQPMIYIIQLIELLEKACIRFVHFSRENELRSRVFNEKMGLESGWNCHISLKSGVTQDKKQNRIFDFEGLTGNQDRHDRNKVDFYKRLSLPINPFRPAWFLDLPKWQECNSVNQKKFYDEELQSNKSDDDPYGYEMPNRAQLPTGIENIRPHLQNMDDVPLLVSLFTDCTSETTKEMVKIMQEYEEVVCVFGSSANLKNLSVFMQANASLAIEPLYPQICQTSTVYVPPKNSGPSPLEISRILNSIPTCLSFEMKDEVSIFHLIKESRQFVLSFVNCMKFWIASCCLISSLQLCMFCSVFEPFISTPEAIWLSLVFIPLLSLSLQRSRPDNDLMLISTGKNLITKDYKEAFKSYGGRFIPAFFFLLSSALQKQISMEVRYPDNIFLEIYLILISLSCLYPFHQIWIKFYNPVWIIVTLFLFTIRVSTDLLLRESYPPLTKVPMGSWITWSIGLVLIILLNEIIKYYEIKSNVRHQKRARLDFGTKLGINSPF